MASQATAHYGPEIALTSVKSSASAISVSSMASSCRNSQDFTGASICSNMSVTSVQSSTTAQTTLSATPSLSDVSVPTVQQNNSSHLLSSRILPKAIALLNLFLPKLATRSFLLP